MAARARRILVAEDQETLRTSISRNLRARGFEVIEAVNGMEALSLWDAEQPQLLILDVMMPRMDGLEVCRRVRERSTVPIVVLTAMDAESDKVAAFDLGADDYLCKPFSVEELLARVRAVLRRADWFAQPPTPEVRRYGDLTIDLEGHTVSRRGELIQLTPTEFALLAQLVTNANKAVSHHTLLQRVWGSEYSGEAEYLRVYIGRLRRKLEADPSNPRYLLTEPGIGYRFMP
ncbi:MAG TPA: response regulator transcription factor [Roseiflexaceae bacterium]|nr:response regulator transcription factor [Roseiflexaceae bacterium]